MIFEVLARNRDFRRLFVGNSISLLGSSVTIVALPLTAVLYLHASPAQMGLLGAVTYLANLVLGLPAGVWVQRLAYRRILVLTDLLQAVILGSVPVLAAFGVLRIWQLYLVATLAGVATLFETVTADTFTPLLVPRRELFPANSALRLSNTTVNTTGSALGGLLVTLLTAPIAIGVDAVSFLVSGLLKARIRNPGQLPAPSPAPEQHLRADIVEGLRVVFAHRVLRAVIGAATVGAFAGQVQAVVLVLFLVRDLGLSAGLVGVAIAVSGVAGILGALGSTGFTRRVGPGPAFICGMFLASGAGLVLAAAAGPVLVAAPILVLAQVLRGTGPTLYGVNQQTIRQTMIPAVLLSRANATWRFLTFGGQTLGALLGGLLGSVIGLRATLIASSALMLLATASAALSPVRSVRELPDQEASAGPNRHQPQLPGTPLNGPTTSAVIQPP